MTKKCGCCARWFLIQTTSGRPTEYCSISCRDVSRAQRKRIEKAQRKAVLKGATIEKVDPFVVFERDGWICQLCGDLTPKDKRGTIDSKAPELDHITALANGGAHSYANTQCSCRSCNMMKSNTKTFEAAEITRLLG